MTDKPVTLINISRVQPGEQQRLIELLAQAMESSVQNAAGFISARLHRSIDGTKVTMYAQWRSSKDYESMRADPAALPYLKEALKIATFEPGMYEVVMEFRPANRVNRSAVAAWQSALRAIKRFGTCGTASASATTTARIGLRPEGVIVLARPAAAPAEPAETLRYLRSRRSGSDRPRAGLGFRVL